MQTNSRDQGAYNALAIFGLAKYAGKVKDFLIGDPSRFLKEMNSGKLFTRHGAIAQGMNPHVPGNPWMTALNVGLNYGLPAYGLYETAQAPASSRGSALGSAVGGLAGGLVGAPLGLAGNMVGGVLGSSLGEGVGRLFNKHDPSPQAKHIQARVQQAAQGLAFYPGSNSHAVARAAKPLSVEMSEITQRPTEFER